MNKAVKQLAEALQKARQKTPEGSAEASALDILKAELVDKRDDRSRHGNAGSVRSALAALMVYGAEGDVAFFANTQQAAVWHSAKKHGREFVSSAAVLVSGGMTNPTVETGQRVVLGPKKKDKKRETGNSVRSSGSEPDGDTGGSDDGVSS